MQVILCDTPGMRARDVSDLVSLSSQLSTKLLHNPLRCVPAVIKLGDHIAAGEVCAARTLLRLYAHRARFASTSSSTPPRVSSGPQAPFASPSVLRMAAPCRLTKTSFLDRFYRRRSLRSAAFKCLI